MVGRKTVGSMEGFFTVEGFHVGLFVGLRDGVKVGLFVGLRDGVAVDGGSVGLFVGFVNFFDGVAVD